jgi:BirA family biotin operon repressor/biotin-[acetyl-CoA-carboxylase] ligase
MQRLFNLLMSVRYLKEISSTNDYVFNLLKYSELEHGFCVSANFQNAGKGQSGNVWEAEAGKNLLFSIFLNTNKIPVNQQFILSEIVSVSIVNVLKKYVPSVKIKWANDIFFKKKKLAGILIKTIIKNNEMISAVIGIGLNVNQLKFVENKGKAISLRMILGKKLEKSKILIQIVTEILANYGQFNSANQKTIENKYFSQLIRTDDYYPYKAENETFFAKITAVESNGCLHLLTKSGKEKKFLFKEVEFLF